MNTLANLFAAPAIPAVPATGNPTFSGAPSRLTKIEGATVLQVLKVFFNLPPVDKQLASPHSPLMTVLADAPNIPGVNLLVSNKPPAFLPLLLGEHVTTTSYQGMQVVQIGRRPSGDYVVAIHGGAEPSAADLPLDRLLDDRLPDGSHRRSPDLPAHPARRHRRRRRPENGGPDLVGGHRARHGPRERARGFGGCQYRDGGGQYKIVNNMPSRRDGAAFPARGHVVVQPGCALDQGVVAAARPHSPKNVGAMGGRAPVHQLRSVTPVRAAG